MSDAAPLVQALREPTSVLALDGAGWTALVATARAEQLLGTLAHRVAGLDLPAPAARMMEAARWSAEAGRVAALWEGEMARRALAPIGCPVVLLKGTAYAAAGLAAGVGRHIGDCDILVPRDRIEEAEAALLAAGWEWVKPDPYDDAYYRRWMHELPPLIHRERDKMVDVHHTILPLTARITPDADALLADRVELGNGLSVLGREDMVLHAVAHLFADGDLAGGLRNLWDIHRLLDEFSGGDFVDRLGHRALLHGLERELRTAVRLQAVMYGGENFPLAPWERLCRQRLVARDTWGRPTRRLLRQAFYVRSHWLRMPPTMLARHLWTKWRKGGAGPSAS